MPGVPTTSKKARPRIRCSDWFGAGRMLLTGTTEPRIERCDAETGRVRTAPARYKPSTQGTQQQRARDRRAAAGTRPLLSR